MSKQLGKLLTCDRCGATEFLPYTGTSELDGGFTHTDHFSKPVEPWSISEIMWRGMNMFNCARAAEEHISEPRKTFSCGERTLLKMIKLENAEVLGWEAAIRGMRNPMNSWEKSDTKYFHLLNDDTGVITEHILLGEADCKLMMNLARAGSVDAKYRRMIVVTVDITAPLYWWKEFDTYKIGTVANSCSTMHKIHAKEFTLEDFSCEHLLDHADIEMPDEIPSNQPLEIGDAPVVVRGFDDNYHDMIFSPLGGMRLIIDMLNRCRELFLETKDKRYWWQMIQLLPNSYNQRRTVMLNYEVLAGIYPKRKDHKLDEWHEFCDWIRGLPYSEIITLEEKA